MNQLPALPAPRCPSCAAPTPSGETCGECLNQPPHFDATLAAFEYRFPLVPMIVAFKYQAQFQMLDFFTRALVEAIDPPTADCILPLPLHRSRLCERGFNQSAELAKRLARRWRLPILLDACVRDRNTTSQAPLTAAARRTNIQGAFRSTRDFSGQHVLVVDDVMTTGSTLNELARVLKARGAARVTNCVIARTLLTPGSPHRA